ncbi:MAG: hypothetical protein ACREE7_11100 [Dongiaceae bacterium]
MAALPLAVAATLYLAGCNGGGATTEKKNGEEAHEHEHPAHGPNGGHLIELGKEEYHAEWVVGAGNKVTIYILDGKGEKPVPIAAETVTIVAKDAKGEQSFDLPAVNRTTGDMPSASQFELESAELAGSLETLGGENTATFKADINGKPFEEKIEPGHHH